MKTWMAISSPLSASDANCSASSRSSSQTTRRSHAVDNQQTTPQTAVQPPQSDQTANTLIEADTAVKAPHQPGYSRVSPAQATEIVRLKRINPKITLEEIRAAIGVKSISTVSYWLRELDNDTVQEARKHAKTNALRASMKLTEQIDDSDPRVSQGAAKAISALAGVQEGSAQV